MQRRFMFTKYLVKALNENDEIETVEVRISYESNLSDTVIEKRIKKALPTGLSLIKVVSGKRDDETRYMTDEFFYEHSTLEKPTKKED